MVSVIKRTYKDGKETKTCPKCKTEKFVDEFYPNNTKARGLDTYCIECNVIYRIEHRDYTRNAYAEKRKEFLGVYGNKCVCCGEDNYEFLTIEHRLGQKGIKKQGSYSAYRSAIQEYRPDLYEVLCMNCNHSRGRYGYCPHQRGKHE